MKPAAEPNISLSQISLARDAGNGLWKIGWQVENQDAAGLKIFSARLPHGQFKSPEQSFQPELEIGSGASRIFETAVYCNEPAGLVTENAFVILYCEWRGEAWRIFVRIRVVINGRGEPETATELITTQKVGFSAIKD